MIFGQNVAVLGSGLQSAQQNQLSIGKRLEAVVLDFNSINDSMSNINGAIMSLSAHLGDIQAAVNQSLIMSDIRQSDGTLAHESSAANSHLQWHISSPSNDTANPQDAEGDIIAIRSSVDMMERTLYKLMLDFTEHVQSTGQALDELTGRVRELEWSVDSDDGGGHEQVDIVKHRLQQPAKAMP